MAEADDNRSYSSSSGFKDDHDDSDSDEDLQIWLMCKFDSCHKAYSNPADLAVHKLQAHRKQYLKEVQKLNLETSNNQDDETDPEDLNLSKRQSRRPSQDLVTDETFTTRRLLGEEKEKQQRRRGNTVRKELICKYCQKEFKFKYNKTVHERLHTGERPYICKIKGCDYRAMRKDALISHGNDHKPLKLCHSCNKFFKRTSSNKLCKKWPNTCNGCYRVLSEKSS